MKWDYIDIWGNEENKINYVDGGDDCELVRVWFEWTLAQMMDASGCMHIIYAYL